ncbi:hypothetical protein [Nitrincola alkalilacustris]|uniref:hypothetical protein n=1 Tax=Nitrincola alkalilacustris TaxID=1571224 RepID=UPI00124C07DA|nr:hypothetical protein [Nitrincola alkalilacustris]
MPLSAYLLNLLGVAIVILGLNLKRKWQKTGIALAVAGFLIGTSPVWYVMINQPSDEEIIEYLQEQHERQLKIEQMRQDRELERPSGY